MYKRNKERSLWSAASPRRFGSNTGRVRRAVDAGERAMGQQAALASESGEGAPSGLVAALQRASRFRCLLELREVGRHSSVAPLGLVYERDGFRGLFAFAPGQMLPARRAWMNDNVPTQRMPAAVPGRTGGALPAERSLWSAALSTPLWFWLWVRKSFADVWGHAGRFLRFRFRGCWRNHVKAARARRSPKGKPFSMPVGAGEVRPYSCCRPIGAASRRSS